MKYAFLFVFWAFLETGVAFSQPSIQWQRSFGGSDSDEPTTVLQTTDGGYVVAGYSRSIDGDIFGSHGYMDAWVIKISPGGDVEWKKAYGGTDLDWIYSLKQTSDGGYVMAGQSSSNNWDVSGNQGLGDFWVVKLGETGNIQWQRSLGGSKVDFGRSIDITPDGGYIVAGYTESTDGDVSEAFGGWDYWVVKLDEGGVIQWQRSYGGSGNDLCRSISATMDGGYIVGGESRSENGDIANPKGGKDYWVLKLNFEGKILWEKSLGGTSSDVGVDILEAREGGYVAFGHAHSINGDISNPRGMFDYWVVRLDEEGEIVWEKSLGGSENEYTGDITQTQDSGFVLLGLTQSTNGDVVGNDGAADMWLVKITGDGDLEWQKALGGSKTDYGQAIQQTTDGGYIAAGYSLSNDGDVAQNKGLNDFWIVKLSKETTPTRELPAQTLQIYPNPANETIHLQIPNSNPEPLEITLFGPAGQEMRRFSAQSSAGVDVSSLPVGVYSVRAQTLEGVVYLGRFTKS